MEFERIKGIKIPITLFFTILPARIPQNRSESIRKQVIHNAKDPIVAAYALSNYDKVTDSIFGSVSDVAK